MGWDILNFFPQMPDMDGNRVIAFIEIFIAPYLMEKLLCTHHISLMAAKAAEYGKFCGCKSERPFVQGTFVSFHIQ